MEREQKEGSGITRHRKQRWTQICNRTNFSSNFKGIIKKQRGVILTKRSKTMKRKTSKPEKKQCCEQAKMLQKFFLANKYSM